MLDIIKFEHHRLIFESINSEYSLSNNHSKEFNEFMKYDKDQKNHVCKMYWIWDENYCLQSWRSIINKDHAEKKIGTFQEILYYWI